MPDKTNTIYEEYPNVKPEIQTIRRLSMRLLISWLIYLRIIEFDPAAGFSYISVIPATSANHQMHKLPTREVNPYAA